MRIVANVIVAVAAGFAVFFAVEGDSINAAIYTFLAMAWFPLMSRFDR